MININLSSIPTGISFQTFQWVIKKGEYDFFYEDLYINGEFKVNNIHKTQIEFEGVIDFKIELICDRCLTKFKRDFSEKVLFILKKDYLGDELDIINFTDYLCDITDYIKDIVVTSIPSKNLCKDDCKGICPKCGANLNYEKCKCNI
uniref:DUF177 domain-containing protein n=1 Tax=candidate division WOR-3 bacterium TaxID=2052148 RepID=A0A7C3J5W6_UNCW3